MGARSVAFCAATLLVAPGATLAHVTLEQQEAAAGSTYKAVPPAVPQLLLRPDQARACCRS